MKQEKEESERELEVPGGSNKWVEKPERICRKNTGGWLGNQYMYIRVSLVFLSV